MASYQDIESRLAVIEDKVDFIMKVFTLQAVQHSVLEGVAPKVVTKSLLDTYLATKHAGLTLINPTNPAEE